MTDALRLHKREYNGETIPQLLAELDAAASALARCRAAIRHEFEEACRCCDAARIALAEETEPHP